MISEAKELARQMVVGPRPRQWPSESWHKIVDRWTTEVSVDDKGLYLSGGDVNPHGSQYGARMCSLREFVDEKSGEGARANIRNQFGDAVLAEVTAFVWQKLIDTKRVEQKPA